MRFHYLTACAASLVAFIVLGAGCVEQSPDTPSEDDVKAAREHILSAPPASIKHPVGAELENKVSYLGIDVDTDVVTPGKPFTLTHYWRVNEPLTEEWRLFVHLEAPGTKASHLNADHIPIRGKYPVHAWKKGEIIRDIHTVSVPQTWKGSAVEIYVGLWKGPLRLKVVSGPKDNENRIFAVKLPTSVKPPEVKKMIARRVKPGSVKLDGKLDDAAWKEAPSTGVFVKTMDGAAAEQKTEAKVVWDDKNLYVAFELEDKDVWTTLTNRDDKLWTQEAVEVFIDADGDGKTYIELQANPKGAIFDSYLPAYRQNQNDWQSEVKVAVNVDGTVDKRDDADKGWTVEMQIPFEAARGKEKEMKNVPPAVGTSWRVNFFRMDLPSGKPQAAAGWAAPLVPDFHALDKFGQLIFGDEKGEVPAAVAAPGTPPAPGTTAAPEKGAATPEKGAKTDEAPKATPVKGGAKAPKAGGAATKKSE